MSWSGFKKALNRTGTQVLMKAGYIESTADERYESCQQQFKELEKDALKLQREARGYLDSFRQVSRSQLEIVELVNTFFESQGLSPDGKFSNNIPENKKVPPILNEFLIAVQQLHEKTNSELDEPYRQTVLAPIAEFTGYFGDVNEAMRKREHKRIDYDLLRAKVKKLEDRNNSNQTVNDQFQKVQKNCDLAQQAYETINSQLKTELPHLLEQKVPYLDPSFESFVKIQLQYANHAYTVLNSVQNYMEPAARDHYAHGMLDEKVDDVLGRMKQLNITSGNPALCF